MATGTVRWWSSERRYGFIAPHHGGPDVFVHASGVLGVGDKTLAQGQEVEYERGTGKDGRPQAVHVVVVSDPGDRGEGKLP